MKAGTPPCSSLAAPSGRARRRLVGLALAASLLACAEEPRLRAAPVSTGAAETPAVPPPAEPARHATWGGVEVELRGEGTTAVILLHGYGAPGGDLVSLGEHFAREAHVRVAIPAAPRAWVGGGEGRAWYERAPTDLDAEVERAAGEIAAVRDGLVAEGRTIGDVVLAGFSQGGSLSLEVALASPAPPRAVIVLSGRVLARFDGRWDHLSGVPVFVSHGRGDPVIPFSDGELARDRATAAGATVTFVPFDGPHAIPDEVETAAIELLRSLD